jgi:S-adenosylmethionine synthetase
VIPDERIGEAIAEVFDLTPGGIIRDLDLLRPIYAATSSLGHFGRWRDPAVYRWEGTERVEALRGALLQRGDPGFLGACGRLPANEREPST